MPQRGQRQSRTGARRMATTRGRPTTRPRGSSRTREQLYQEARRKNIRGRSRMTKAQLQRALSRS